MPLKHIYYINLDRRTDRWEECMEKINSTCLKDFPYTRFSGFDGKEYTTELKRFKSNSIYEDSLNQVDNKLSKLKIIYKKGEVGCLISHLCVLINILNNNNFKEDDYVCIFEEDFRYAGTTKNFNKTFLSLNQLDLNKLDIDFLYLGGRFKPNFYTTNNCYTSTDNVNIWKRSKYVSEYDNDRGAFSYVVKKSICKKLIQIIIDNFIKNNKYNSKLEPVDCIYQVLIDEIKSFDYFPHIFHSPVNYKSDVFK
jgi:GR25 family glycosyltransferase involved in LPS biosynthesis